MDINKGDEDRPEYRSRLVAKDLKTDKREDLFAATPPLEALKLLISMAMPEGIGYQKEKENQGMQLEFIDIKRAYLQAPTRRALYVQLPDEDAEPGKCAKLNKAMSGTRDAAQNWEWTYRSSHEEWGFKVGRSSPRVMYHPTRNVRLVVHGDDFTALGYEADLDWYRKVLTHTFEAKVKCRLGQGIADEKSMRLLNRIVHWTPSGIEYEADQRHAEIVIRELGLKPDSKSVNTPGTAAKWEELEDDEPLNSQDRIWYRQVVARGNYISQDRCDIQYAVKELSRSMSSSKASDMRAVRRLGRYLVGRTRYGIRYER